MIEKLDENKTSVLEHWIITFGNTIGCLRWNYSGEITSWLVLWTRSTIGFWSEQSRVPDIGRIATIKLILNFSKFVLLWMKRIAHGLESETETLTVHVIMAEWTRSTIGFWSEQSRVPDIGRIATIKLILNFSKFVLLWMKRIAHGLESETETLTVHVIMAEWHFFSHWKVEKKTTC